MHNEESVTLVKKTVADGFNLEVSGSTDLEDFQYCCLDEQAFSWRYSINGENSRSRHYHHINGIANGGNNKRMKMERNGVWLMVLCMLVGVGVCCVLCVVCRVLSDV